MNRRILRNIALVLVFALALSGCGKKEEKPAEEPVKETGADVAEPAAEEPEEEDQIPPEQMDLIKYNYYVDLNNELIDVLDNIEYYFAVVADEEEFSLLPDTGLTYGFNIVRMDEDLVKDCLALAEMDPDYGEMDELVTEMGDSLLILMEAFDNICTCYSYADNQYEQPKEFHKAIYSAVGTFQPLAYEYMDAISEMGDAKTEEDEAKMLEEGNLIIYNASRAISISREIMDEIYDQGITDETITDLDLTRIRELHDELVAVVADFNAATEDNDQLMKESISNSRPFDGLLDSLIQALEWMIKQVESGQPLDLSGSGAPLGSSGHFAEVISKCIDRYNTVFVE